jgi:hypothetical protein
MDLVTLGFSRGVSTITRNWICKYNLGSLVKICLFPYLVPWSVYGLVGLYEH